MKVSVREENHLLVRRRVAEAVAAHLAERGMDELTLPAIARRASISVATIYRYYPTRDALFDAYTAWIRDKLGVPSFDVALGDWPAQVVKAFTGFDRISDIVRGQLAWPSLPSFRHVRRRRLAAVERTLAPLLARLDTRTRLRVLGVFSVLTGAHAWQVMRDDWGLDGAQAGEAAAWALRTLISSLARPTKRRTPRPRAKKARRT